MNAQSGLMSDIDRNEVSAVEVTRVERRAKTTPISRWFFALGLKQKVRLATLLGQGSLIAVALLALLGFSDAAWVPTARTAIILLTVMSLTLTTAAVAFIEKYVIDDFLSMTQEMKRLAQGSRDIEISGVNRRDELGQLARSFEYFVKAGHKLDELFADRTASADLRKEELSRLATQFETNIGNVVAGVAAASSQLQGTASSMASAAEQSVSQTGTVSNSMDQASKGMTAAAAASDEFAMSIGEISRQATNSAELARKATKTAADADGTISALSDSAEQVGQIVELIQSIAQRTNLLALNASIEAARGGEAGRGFAVVASEVKELAAQTSKATDEVAQQIRAMQDSTGASVTALRSIGEQIKQLETTAISIASAVDQQSVAGQDLARSIDLAARGSDEVADSIAQVRETAMSTGSAASQVLNSATELEGQASTLRNRVDEFLRHVRALD
ncbi:methyl-accepting chemotaxis protein [Qipengyuania spongiae]|uniref:Methyl-accepting chemotaxis protein n=1 Tax=Qipengyuania spongiae TaxID=2909673 RepID=A0ABY5T5S0_9SPHN|nr:HAMP domain-containing methyl-accepting chemotaxis protein [Qipengyuania spongiae]UVI40294.1 methyl-accepting chemotaxis protein [Qipengyuania spongiae]